MQRWSGVFQQPVKPGRRDTCSRETKGLLNKSCHLVSGGRTEENFWCHTNFLVLYHMTPAKKPCSGQTTNMYIKEKADWNKSWSWDLCVMSDFHLLQCRKNLSTLCTDTLGDTLLSDIISSLLAGDFTQCAPWPTRSRHKLKLTLRAGKLHRWIQFIISGCLSQIWTWG